MLQLSRYGRTTTGPAHYVVLGELFSDQEVELFSYPLNPKDPSGIGQLRKWIERSGGLRGQPRGIHCNHFVPMERILDRVRQILEEKVP